MAQGKFSLRCRSLAALFCGFMLLSSSGCSSEESESSSGSGTETVLEQMPATEVCDGTLHSDAAAGLERISGETLFSEQNHSRLVEYLRMLRRSDDFRELFCDIYTPAHSESPFARVYFRWTTREEVSGTEADSPREDEVYRYQAGMRAYVEENSAFIYFSCPANGAPDGMSILGGGLYTSLEGAVDPDPAISIINSISRAVADGLDCLPESELPAGTPAPL
jgi:hypothetical protein